MANEKNLRPIKSKKKARELGSKGGIKSGIAKREKKFMSEIYAEFLAKKHDVLIDNKKAKLTGQQLVSAVIRSVLDQGGSPSVSMLKEIREATEGSQIALTDPDGEKLTGISVNFINVKRKDLIDDENKSTG